MKSSVDCSVLMLVENSDVDFSDYLVELHEHLNQLGLSHELILALNGPNDFAQTCLDKWPQTGAEIIVLELNRRVFSGICLQVALERCQGEVLVICGPYRQVADDGLGSMLQAIFENRADIALPWRRNRVDPPINQLQSRLFNSVVHYLTGVKVHDLNCSLRVVRRAVLEETVFHGDLYRFLPLMAKKRGFRTLEIPSSHIQEFGEIGYFGLRVYVNRLIDLFAIHFNLHFSRKPLRYFGFRGGLILFVGLLLMLTAVVFRIAEGQHLGSSPQVMFGLILSLAGGGLW